MAKKIEVEMDFNTWARTYKVSSLWDIHKPENKQFVERLENYRYAIAMYPSKETEELVESFKNE